MNTNSTEDLQNNPEVSSDDDDDDDDDVDDNGDDDNYEADRVEDENEDEIQTLQNSEILYNRIKKGKQSSSSYLDQRKKQSQIFQARSNKRDTVYKTSREKETFCKPLKTRLHIYVLWTFIGLLVLGVYQLSSMYYDSDNPKSQPTAKYQEDDRITIFMDNMSNMRKNFPQQSNRSWNEIEGGIMELMKSSLKPWTFVLFSNETKTVSCFAELLGKMSSRALQSDQSLVLKPRDMGTDYGEVIDHLKSEIQEKKTLIVHNILDIHPGAIQIFHSLCDRENPLVSGSVNILTIIAAGSIPSQKYEPFIENLLTTRFVNKVDKDKLQPLITRIMDGPLILVKPAQIPDECSG